MFPLGTSALVGLDIGSSTLKGVELKKKGDRLVVGRAAIAAMPSGAISDGALLDPPAVSDCIRRFCRDQKLRGSRVAVGLGGEDVFITRLKLERATGDALKASVRQETARLAPFLVEPTNFDFEVLDNFSDSQWIDALVVAAKPGRVERLHDLIKRAGKTPALVDSTACALVNAYAYNYEPQSTEIIGLLHLGASAMTVCIVRGSTPVLAKELSLARTQLNNEEWSLTDRIAVNLERVFELMDEVADEHPLEPRSSQIQRLLTSGGAAHARGLGEMLRNRIRLPFGELNPFHRIEFDGSNGLSRLVWDHAHCMPVAVGLALRGFEQL